MFLVLAAQSGAGAAAVQPTPPAPTTSAATPSGYVAQSFFYTKANDADESLTATYSPAARNAAWVVVIHGGSWSSGAQSSVQPAVDAFSKAGLQVFNISYRLIADTDAGEAGVAWSAQKQDVLTAITWIRSHATQFGLDPNRGAVWGFSAGGHLAAIAGLSGDGDNGIRAIVTNSGVLAPGELASDVDGSHNDGTVTQDMRGLASWETVATGCPYQSSKGTCAQRWTDFDPASYISAHDPAVMIYQGTADPVVPYQSAQSFAQKLTAANIPNSVVLVPKLGHDWHASIDGSTRQAAMVRFIEQRTAVNVAPSTSTVTTSAARTSLTNAQTTTVAAQVSSANGTNGGSVRLESGSYHAIALLSGGSATVTVPAMSPGTRVITVSYSGTSLTQTATSSVTLHVSRVAPTIYWTTTPKPLRAGHTHGAKLVLTVHAPVGVPSSATMTVLSGRAVVGRARVVNGRVAITLPSLGEGKHDWTAEYSGTSTVAAGKKSLVVAVAR